MANAPDDRARMRNDLRELAKLATPAPPPSQSHRFETADSSGYVDLSAFSANDASWVDRELARARAGSPPPLPKTGAGSSRTIDALTPQSMAPVALESLLANETSRLPARSRGRRALTVVATMASIAGVAALAVVVARRAPVPAQTPQPTAAAAAAPQPAASPSETTETPPAAASAVTSPPATAPTTNASSAPASAAASHRKAAPAVRAHVAAAAPAAAPHAATAAKPVVIPAAKSKSSGDSLMDAIRSSVAHGK